MQIRDINSKQSFDGKVYTRICKNQELREQVQRALPEIKRTIKDKNYDVFITNKTDKKGLDIVAGTYPKEMQHKNNSKVFLPDIICNKKERIVHATNAVIFHLEELQAKQRIKI